jgi:hypothetical protein
MMSVTAVPPGVVAGCDASIEERVDALEDGLARLRDYLDERARELRAEAREAANEAAGRAASRSDDWPRRRNRFSSM